MMRSRLAWLGCGKMRKNMAQRDEFAKRHLKAMMYVMVILTFMSFVNIAKARDYTKPLPQVEDNWSRIQIENYGSIDVPPSMEVIYGLYAQLQKKMRSDFIDTGTEDQVMLIQQKGVSDFQNNSLDLYASVSLSVTDSGSSQQEYDESIKSLRQSETQRLAISKSMEEYFRGLLRSHKGRLLEWGGVRVLNVNEMQAISADFKRQWNKNPTVCVRSYSFYGKGKTYTLVMAYREKDSLMWRDDYAKMLASFRLAGVTAYLPIKNEKPRYEVDWVILLAVLIVGIMIMKLHLMDVHMFDDVFSGDGRIRRSEYIMSYITISYLIFLMGGVFLRVALSELSVVGLVVLGFVALLYCISLIALLTQGVKRCHDVNVSGVCLFIPLSTIYLMFRDSYPAVNKWGRNPKSCRLYGLQKETRIRKMRMRVEMVSSRLSDKTKKIIVAFMLWFVWVWFRTSGGYEIVGIYFDAWDEDMFWVNFFLPPFVLLGGWRIILRLRSVSKKPEM